LDGRITACICLFGGAPGNETYGDNKKYCDLHARLLRGLVKTSPHDRIDLRIGLNAVGYATIQEIARAAKHINTRVYYPNENMMKYPRLRQMIHDDECPVQTQWVLVLDDDADFVHDDWFGQLSEAVDEGLVHGARCFGEKYRYRLSADNLKWHRSRPWWRGRKLHGLFQTVEFCTGGWWLMKTADLVELDWPDTALYHNGGDVALGSAMYQREWPLWDCKNLIDVHNTPRRGHSEPHPVA